MCRLFKMFAAKNGVFVVLLAWCGSTLSRSNEAQKWKYDIDESEYIVGEILVCLL